MQQQQQHHQPPVQKFISWGGVANICTATLGAGVVSLPNAFRKAGLIGGSLLIAVAAYASYWSIALLSDALDAVGRDLVTSDGQRSFSSFESTTERICGKKLSAVVKAAIIASSWGACIAYLVAVGDMLEDALIKTTDTSLTRENVMFIFWLLVMLPLSLIGRIEYLKWSSSVGVFCVLFFVFVSVYKSFEGLAKEGYEDSWGSVGVKMWPDSFAEFMQACPIVIFAFTCQTIVPRIYHELGEDIRTPAYMRRVILRGVSVSSTIYIIMGVFTYFEFGDLTDEDVLKNFCVENGKDAVIITAFVFMALKLCVAVPLNVFPCRDSIYYIAMHEDEKTGEPSDVSILSDDKSFARKEIQEKLEMKVDNDKEVPLLERYLSGIVDSDQEVSSTTDSTVVSDVESGAMSFKWHVGLTLVISVSALFVALIVPDISIVLGLLGGTSTALLTYIMPAIFNYRLNLAQNDPTKRIVIWLFIVLGTFVGTLSTVYTLLGIFDGNGGDDDLCEESR